MSGVGRVFCYVAGTVVLVVTGLLLGVATADCDTGECDLSGLAGLVVALWTLGACVLGIIVIECLGVLGHQVGDSRLMGGSPPSELWRR